MENSVRSNSKSFHLSPVTPRIDDSKGQFNLGEVESIYFNEPVNSTFVSPPEVSMAKVPTYTTLTGNYIILKELKMNHIEFLYNETHGSIHKEKVWEYMPYGPFDSIASMQKHFQGYKDATDKLVFCVLKEEKPVGIVCLSDSKPSFGNIEIASVTYSINSQRTEANTEAVYLLIEHCINELGFRKIVWKCDSNNLASRNAALRLGFELEGLFCKHMMVKGKNRDTAWFGITNEKWEKLAPNYKNWLDENDPQKRSSLREANMQVEKYSAITHPSF